MCNEGSCIRKLNFLAHVVSDMFIIVSFRRKPCTLSKERQSLRFLRLFLDDSSGQVTKVFSLNGLLIKTGAIYRRFSFPFIRCI